MKYDGKGGCDTVEQMPSVRSMEPGFEAFSNLVGGAMKSLEKLKSKGMGEFGLSGTHTMCMRQLYESQSGLTRTELARRCGVDRAQVTRVIGELLATELVLEVGTGSNYRKKCILTPRGREVAVEVNQLVRKIQHFVSGDIPEERLEIFYQTLGEICDNLKRAEDIL